MQGAPCLAWFRHFFLQCCLRSLSKDTRPRSSRAAATHRRGRTSPSPPRTEPPRVHLAVACLALNLPGLYGNQILVRSSYRPHTTHQQWLFEGSRSRYLLRIDFLFFCLEIIKKMKDQLLEIVPVNL